MIFLLLYYKLNYVLYIILYCVLVYYNKLYYTTVNRVDLGFFFFCLINIFQFTPPPQNFGGALVDSSDSCGCPAGWVYDYSSATVACSPCPLWADFRVILVLFQCHSSVISVSFQCYFSVIPVLICAISAFYILLLFCEGLFLRSIQGSCDPPPPRETITFIPLTSPFPKELLPT